MKNILIYFPEHQLASKGGPAGYLYNLKNGLKAVSQKELNIIFYKSTSVNIEENQFLRKRIPKRMREIRRAYKYAKFLKSNVAIDSQLLQYDAIHFHKTEDVYLNRRLLEKYSGKVILTSHTPCVSYREIIDRLNPFDYKMLKGRLNNLVKMDVYAFKRADYIIFPCEEAEEPYFHTWSAYASIREASKYRYIPTGIMGCRAAVSKETIRRQYGIPNSAFVVSYVGRHNEIKGYGDLKEIAEKIFKADDNIFFLIAGKEEPMKGLKKEHWIEVGWTNDPHSLIAASDAFILPNHETYFDLVLLEVISLGIPVVLSETGGNNYFKRFNQKGFKFYNNLEQAEKSILDLSKTDPLERQQEGKSLQILFNNNFTVEKFTQRYVEVLQDLVNSEE